MKSTRISDLFKIENLKGQKLNVEFATGYDLPVKTWFLTIYINKILVFNYFPLKFRLSSLEFLKFLNDLGVTLSDEMTEALSADDGQMTNVNRAIIATPTLQELYKNISRLKSYRWFQILMCDFSIEFYNNKFAKFTF
jgi:hypothetical protein